MVVGRTELPKQWKERETSPERTKVWTEPKGRTAVRKVPVVYYLSRDGHLEHPHFMEISLSSGEGLYLRDVIERLNSLRGKGMAGMYSWSSKRRYRNGFVWHDLSEDDFIYPAHGHEYVLKGSELFHFDTSPRSQDSTISIPSLEKPPEIPKSVRDDSDLTLGRRKKIAWNSVDLNEYKVYKNELTAETAMDAWTQIDDKGQRRRAHAIEEKQSEISKPEEENPMVALDRGEISPPPTSSSPETFEAHIKADGRIVTIRPDGKEQTADNYSRVRIRASAALMNLISCGSISIKDRGFSLVSHFSGRLPRAVSDQGAKEDEGLKENPNCSAIKLEDKNYFSGSLIEMKQKGSDGAAEVPRLRRSSSYNGDRGLKLELAEKEIEGVRARCIPRKAKATVTRKEASKGIADQPLQQ